MRKLACIVVVAACGGGGSTNVKPPLKFADRSDTELAAMIKKRRSGRGRDPTHTATAPLTNATSGAVIFQVQAAFDHCAGSTDPGPSVSAAGSTITLTG